MRRRMWATAAALVISTPLVACTEAGEEPIQFWNPLTGDDGQFMRQIVEEYNATEPEVPVEFMPAPEADMYPRIYSVARTGDDVPDLVLIHGPRVAELARSEVLEPIDHLTDLQPELSEENYLPSAWESAELDGQTWGIPLDLHGIITFYNEDLLAEYDAERFLDDEIVTVDELLSLEGRLPEGIYAMPGLFMPAMVQGWQYNLGGGFTNSSGDVDLTGQRWADAYEALVNLQEAGLIAPEDSDPMQVFNSGHALFFPDGTWGVSGHEAIDGLNFGTANAIQYQAENPINLLESHLFVQMNDPERTDERDRAVADFVEYVRTHSMKWAEAGQIVASREAYESEEYRQFAQSYFTEPEQEELLMTDNYEYGPYVMGGLWDYTNDIVYGRMSIDRGLAQMNNEVNARIQMAEMS